MNNKCQTIKRWYLRVTTALAERRTLVWTPASVMHVRWRTLMRIIHHAFAAIHVDSTRFFYQPVGLNSGRRADISFARRCCCWRAGWTFFLPGACPCRPAIADSIALKSSSSFATSTNLFQKDCKPRPAGTPRFQNESSVSCGYALFQNATALSRAPGYCCSRFQKLIASRLPRTDTLTSSLCFSNKRHKTMFEY